MLMRNRLRLYTGENQVNNLASPEMTITLGEISNILADAVSSRRSWLADFEDDHIQISSDLYEVLTAYKQLRSGA
jgi:hypothetical protein